MALSEINKNKLNEFVKFVRNELGIKKMPEIRVQYNRSEIKTTANYNYNSPEKVVKIYGKGRALVDIMRSVAHELVHHKQWEDGKLKVRPPDIGGEIEDEANAKAGLFIKMFAKNDDTIYDD